MEKKYSRRVQAQLRGRLLKSFDIFCAEKQLNESEGVYECVLIYINTLRVRKINLSEIKYSEGDLKRNIQSILYGKVLKSFDTIKENRVMSDSELVRECVRFAVFDRL